MLKTKECKQFFECLQLSQEVSSIEIQMRYNKLSASLHDKYDADARRLFITKEKLLSLTKIKEAMLSRILFLAENDINETLAILEDETLCSLLTLEQINKINGFFVIALEDKRLLGFDEGAISLEMLEAKKAALPNEEDLPEENDTLKRKSRKSLKFMVSRKSKRISEIQAIQSAVRENQEKCQACERIERVLKLNALVADLNERMSPLEKDAKEEISSTAFTLAELRRFLPLAESGYQIALVDEQLLGLNKGEGATLSLAALKKIKPMPAKNPEKGKVTLQQVQQNRKKMNAYMRAKLLIKLRVAARSTNPSSLLPSSPATNRVSNKGYC